VVCYCLPQLLTVFVKEYFVLGRDRTIFMQNHQFALTYTLAVQLK
jgi:hypothetical protein